VSTPLPVRAGQLVKLMLSSDKIGEVAGAAAALNRTLATAGRDIYWLAEIVEAALPDAPALVPLDDDCGDWKSVALFCRHHRDRLGGKETEFIETILQYRRSPSERQLRWLSDIHERVRRGTA
jgi:hypothetical protein